MVKEIQTRVLVLFFYATMLMFALWFYMERVVILDASFQLFYMLKDDSFAIQVNRYGAVMTQIFPLLASKIGLSLKAVVMTYSAGFIVLYALTFYILAFRFKNLSLALVFFLFNIGMTTHSFFWIQCELMPGVCISMILLAIIEHQCHNSLPTLPMFSYIYIVPLLLLITFTYPLLPFVITYGVGFFIIYYKQSWLKFLPILGLYFLLIFIKTNYLNNWYDISTSERIHNINKLFPNYFDLVSNDNFASYVWQHWYSWIIVLGIGVYIGFRYRFTKIIIWTLLFNLGFLFVLNVSWAEGAEEFYLEPQYSLLMIFAAFQFIYLANGRWQMTYLQGFIIVIFVAFLIRIVVISPVYSSRVEYLSQLITSANAKRQPKQILSTKDIDLQKLKMSWAIGSESWLLSTIKYGRTTSIIIEDNENQYKKFLPAVDSIIVLNHAFSIKKLPLRYFKVDSVSYTK